MRRTRVKESLCVGTLESVLGLCGGGGGGGEGRHEKAVKSHQRYHRNSKGIFFET